MHAALGHSKLTRSPDSKLMGLFFNNVHYFINSGLNRKVLDVDRLSESYGSDDTVLTVMY